MTRQCILPALAVVLCLSLSLLLAYTKAPWCDEGWFVNPAYDLALHGRMGSSVLEPTGHFLNAYLRGVQERTYIFMPVHLVALAGWIRAFGFSALKVRAYSACWSALALAALFFVLRKLFCDPRVAQLAVLFTAVDFIFLCSTADGRPEAIANCMAISAVAAYLYFRERSMAKAVLASQFFAAAGVFAHPNVFLMVFALAVLAFYLDRARMKFRYALFAAAPYAIFGLLWSFYILQKPSDFVTQFFPQAGFSGRWTGIFRPDIAIGTEIVRHLAAYYFSCPSSGVMKWWMAAIPFLYLPALFWFLRSRRRLERTERGFLIFTLALLCGMTFLNGFKQFFYLIYIVPLYDAVLAAWLLNLWSRSREGRLAGALIATAFVVLQLSISVQHIRADEYHRDFVPTVRELARDRAEGKSIVGTAALGFGLGYQGFRDDGRMGMYSGLEPDVLVVDRSYRAFVRQFAKTEPPVFEHIVRSLSTEYRLASQHGSFWIFERVPHGSRMQPWIDIGKIDSVEKAGRADYFLRELFFGAKLRDAEESSI